MWARKEGDGWDAWPRSAARRGCLSRAPHLTSWVAGPLTWAPRTVLGPRPALPNHTQTLPSPGSPHTPRAGPSFLQSSGLSGHELNRGPSSRVGPAGDSDRQGQGPSSRLALPPSCPLVSQSIYASQTHGVSFLPASGAQGAEIGEGRSLWKATGAPASPCQAKSDLSHGTLVAHGWGGASVLGGGPTSPRGDPAGC